MLDDDLTFDTRIGENDFSLEEISGEELIPEFQHIEDKLGPEYPHVGFGPRQHNDKQEVGWRSPGKMVFTLGYYLPIVAKEVRWDLVEYREDYCTTLQLLLKGYPNAVWTGTVANQTTNAPGGCSIYRTLEWNNAEAKKLADLFPVYVSVELRKYGRLETTVQWEDAFKEGLRRRNQHLLPAAG
jgi:hypothetical protein